MRRFAWSMTVKKLYFLGIAFGVAYLIIRISNQIIMTLPTQNLYEQMFMKQEEPIDFLVTIYEDYLTKHNLPQYDASDMLHAHHIGEIKLHDGQIGWLNNFIRLWDFVSEAEYQNFASGV